jgi:hypothetical protein
MSNPNAGYYVNPIGAGLKPDRIDMGVDYTGSGPLYAVGSGTIENVASGWPGGKFISLLLDAGPYAGKTVYYAENINAAVNVGQHVTTGQQIGTAVGAYPYIEVGWAAPGGKGNTQAALAGEIPPAGIDPGKYSTAYGVSMSNFIASLGGPAGIIQPGGIRGTVASDYPQGANVMSSGVPQTAPSLTSSTDQTLPGCIPLIWMAWYAVRYATQLRRNISRRQRRYRRRENEKRNQKGGAKTDETSLRNRAWLASDRRATLV